MTTAKDVDLYLADVSEQARSALERLRDIVRELAPDAQECISYQIPSFKLNGMLVGLQPLRHTAVSLP